MYSMSQKQPKKPLSPRTVLTKPKVKKKKATQNTYDLVQFKKMIGKGLIEPQKGSSVVQDPSMKEKILTKSVKIVAMTGTVNNGIIYITDGVERLLAINSVSYAEIKKHDLDLEVIVTQT